MTGTGRRRWSWAGRRATGRSRCSERARCYRGWWRSNRCSAPCCSGAPGSCTATKEEMSRTMGRENKTKECGQKLQWIFFLSCSFHE